MTTPMMNDKPVTDESEAAKKYAARLVGGRDYGMNELVAKLSEKYSERSSVEAAVYMRDCGYVNDARYAEKLAERYITVRKYGRSRAALMMRQKLLDEQTIEEALSRYTKDDIEAEIADILRKKYRGRLFLEGDAGKKEMQKVIAALARRGYGYSNIKAALYTVREELESEEE